MYGIDSFLGYIDSFIWFPSKQEIVRNNYFPSDSILSEIFLTWLLWEGIYICKIKILSEMIKVGNDSFRQTQFGPNASETISQRRFLFKKKWYISQFRSLSVVRFNQQTNRRKIQKWKRTLWIITFLILMYRSCNLFFYSQFICAIASVWCQYLQQTHRRKIQNWKITRRTIPFSILMYRSCNMFFCSQFICAIALFF